MARYLQTLFLISGLVLSACVTSAQVPGAVKTAAEPEKPDQTKQLGRRTPRGTMLGFLRAAQSGKFALAAEFLQIPDQDRLKKGTELARKLNAVMSQNFPGSLDRIADFAEGSPGDGLPPNEELVGTVSGDKNGQIVLVRIEDKENGPIWLISAQTLAQVPDWYREVGYPETEKYMPQVLVEHQLFSVPLWRWLAAVLFVPLSLLAAWLLLRLAVMPMRLLASMRQGQRDEAFWRDTSTPLLVVLTMIVHYFAIAAFGIPVIYRQYYTRMVRISLAIGIIWLLWRWINRFTDRVHLRAIGRGDTATGSMLMLGKRVVKAALVLVALLAALSILGFQIGGLLAGLGIGGIAVALAAQKTLENFFGGISVLSDQVIRVGDFCRFGDQRGHVEDIGLRSTTVRTLDRTLLSIPNGALATMTIENFAHRDKIWFHPVIGLRYETPPAQLRQVLDGIRNVLREHPLVEDESARVRFTQFASSSLDIEVFAYVLTADYNQYAVIREDLLLKIMDLIQSAGASVAFPSQTLYLAKDASDALSMITEGEKPGGDSR